MTSVHELADLRGSAAEVLDRLARDFETLAPESVAELRDLVTMLGITASRPIASRSTWASAGGSGSTRR